MDIKKIKDHIEYLKNYSLDTDGFISSIREYMQNTHWTWFDYDHVPNKAEIQKEFFNLLDDLTEHRYIETRGFRLEVNDDTESVDCYFGRRCNEKTITLSSNQDFKDPVMDFVNHLCKKCPALDKEWIRKEYKEWKR